MAIGLSNTTKDLDGSTKIARIGKAVQTGTGAENLAYTGELGEITYDTTDDRLVGHDGSTAGGAPVAKESEVTANALLALPAGAESTFAAGLATVASLGVAVKIVAVTAKKGDAAGFTVATDHKMIPSYTGTRLVRIQGRFLVDVASGTDALTLHVFSENVSIFETAAQSVTASSPALFEFDFLHNLAGPGTFGVDVYAENEDTTANIDTAAYADRVDTTPSHGWYTITTA